jgi:hypothetical protein
MNSLHEVNLAQAVHEPQGNLGNIEYHTPLIRAALNLPRPLLAMAGAAELLSPVCGISSPVGIKEMGFIRPSCCIKRGNSSAVITTFSVPVASLDFVYFGK